MYEAAKLALVEISDPDLSVKQEYSYKLVFVQGNLDTFLPLYDLDLKVSANNSFWLERTVEMYSVRSI